MKKVLDTLIGKGGGAFTGQVGLLLGGQLAQVPGVVKRADVGDDVYVAYTAVPPPQGSPRGTPPSYVNMYFRVENLALISEPVESRIATPDFDVDEFMRKTLGK